MAKWATESSNEAKLLQEIKELREDMAAALEQLSLNEYSQDQDVIDALRQKYPDLD